MRTLRPRGKLWAPPGCARLTRSQASVSHGRMGQIIARCAGPPLTEVDSAPIPAVPTPLGTPGCAPAGRRRWAPVVGGFDLEDLAEVGVAEPRGEAGIEVVDGEIRGDHGS